MDRIRVAGRFSMRVDRADGRVQRHSWSNHVTDEGLGLIAAQLVGGGAARTWAFGLKGPGESFLDDTLASRDWAEPDGIDARVAWTPSVLGARATNAASPAVITVQRACTLRGLFVVSSDGKLLSVADWGNDEDFTPGDTMTVTYELGFAGEYE